MTKKLPAITADELLHILGRHGFLQVRQSDSHIILRHSDGRRTTVPYHKGKTIGKGLLKQIMRDAGLSVDDL